MTARNLQQEARRTRKNAYAGVSQRAAYRSVSEPVMWGCVVSTVGATQQRALSHGERDGLLAGGEAMFGFAVNG